MERRHSGAPRYTLVAEFPDEVTARRAYARVQALLYRADCDLSAYRVLLDGVPHVVVLGKAPAESLDEHLRLALIAGRPAELPPPIIAALAVRRAQQRQKGPWVEEHHRPGKWLRGEE